jgi:hypothetical protein
MQNAPSKLLSQPTRLGIAILAIGVMAVFYTTLASGGVVREGIYFGGLGMSLIGILLAGFGLVIQTKNKGNRA